ncbi:MAG: hypothetical protein ABJP79_00125 [Tateyamaria sp.]|uniref:hypothetical protein n=1 Tax=Tateyamaria sp. TaxID=1929288 RepID=UPI00329FF84E
MKDLTHGPSPGFWWMLWRTGGLLPLLLALNTVMFGITSFGDLKTGLEFRTDGVVATADIVDRSTRRVRGQDGSKTEYLVEFRYFVDEIPFQDQSKVSRALYDTSVIGSTRKVRYLLRNPKKVEFKLGETFARGKLMGWWALGFGVPTLLALWWKGMRAVDAMRAREFGVAERVTVVKLPKHKETKWGSYQLRWFDKDGEFGASLSSVVSGRFAPYPPYTTIEVFRGAKGRMWWVGDVGPRKSARSVPSVDKS